VKANKETLLKERKTRKTKTTGDFSTVISWGTGLFPGLQIYQQHRLRRNQDNQVTSNPEFVET
jgi:hypothetical protein